MKRDIYNFQKRFEKINEKIKNSKKISEHNKKLIFDFLEDCRIDGAGYGEPLSLPRIIRYANTLRFIGEWIETDFDKAEKRDIKKLLVHIEGTYDKPHTKQFYKIGIKKFYKWLHDGEYPDLVRGIKTTVKNTDIPWKLLSEEEIIKMVEVTEHPRDKAFIITLAESGARIGEMASLDIESVIFDELGAKILVDGKTGKRTIRLLASASYLAEWINKHPQKKPNSPLWVNIGNFCKGQAMRYEGFVRILRTTATKAGITKRVNPHSFRHARATQLGKWLKGSQRSVVMGWSKNSRMPQIYDHLNGEDTEDSLFEMCGMEKQNNKTSLLKPKICKVCEHWNEVTSSFCKKCAKPLDLKTAINIDEKKEKDVESVTGMLTPQVLEGLIKKTVESKFEDLIKTHPNASAFIDSIAQEVLAKT